MLFKGFEVKEISGAGKVLAEFATLNVKDHDGDVTEPGAFGEQTVTIIPAHNWGAVPLGKGDIYEDGDKALLDGQMNLETTGGKDWYEALKFDFENKPAKQEWSYGFDILDSGQGEFSGEQVRFLKSLRVHEVSPVLVGAGIDTRTVDIKSVNGGASIQVSKHLELIDEMIEAASRALGRCKGVAAQRAEDGREMSRATREGLEKQLAELDRLAKDYADFLASPVDDAPDLGALFLDFQRITTQFKH